MEVPCLADASGVHPVHIGELPLQLAALNRTYLNVCEHGAGAMGRRGERAKMISQC